MKTIVVWLLISFSQQNSSFNTVATFASSEDCQKTRQQLVNVAPDRFSKRLEYDLFCTQSTILDSDSYRAKK